MACRISRTLSLVKDKQLEEVHNQGNVQTEEDGVDGEWNIVDEEEDQNVDQPTWSRMITSPRGQAVPVEMVCFRPEEYGGYC